MCKFHVGNLVRLVSDTEVHTPMTVEGYLKDEAKFKSNSIFLDEVSDDLLKSVKCVWRDNVNIPHEKYYNEDSLIIIEV